MAEGGRTNGKPMWPYALVAGLAALLARLPFLTSLPPTWDSVQYTLAVLRYDIELHQPHPPGYFLYVYAGKAIHALGLEPYASLVALSLVAGAVMAAVLVAWAGKLGGPRAALATGALTVLSPLAWHSATTGDTYAVSGMMAALVGWLGWRLLTSHPPGPLSARRRAGQERGSAEGSGGLESPAHAEGRGPARRPVLLQAALAGLALAVAGGMRPTDAAFLFPLWVYCVASRGTRALVVGMVALALGTAAWVVPMLRMTGGLGRYLEISHRLSAGVLGVSPWAEPGRAGQYLGALALAALAVLFVGWVLVPLARGTELTRARWFLILWLAPAGVFFVAVHLGPPGYLMVLAPPLLLLAGVGMGRALASLGWGRGLGLLVVVLALNGMFLKTTVIDGQQAQARHFREIQAACAPYAGPETVVLTTAGRTRVPRADLPFRAAMYLLPECDVFLYPLESTGPIGGMPNEGRGWRSYLRTGPVTVRARWVLVDATLVRYLPPGTQPRLVVSNPEGELWAVEVPRGEVRLESAGVEW